MREIQHEDDLRSSDGPTLVEVWAPACHVCTRMAPDLNAVTAEFEGKVERRRLNAATAVEVAQVLGVRGTPTLIGFRDGDEVFRHTGGRSKEELEELFSSLVSGERARSVGSGDLKLRVGAGVVLMLLGIITEPSWALVAVGAVVIGVSIGLWMRR